MNTKRLKSVIIILFISIFASCEKNDYVESFNKQAESIEKYVETLRDTTTILNINGTYAAVVQDGRGEPSQYGDSLYIRYVETYFNSKPAGLIYTNVDSLAKIAGLYIPEGGFKPFGIKVGVTDLIDGLNDGIQEIKLNEQRTIFMPFSKAYGEIWNNTIPPYSSISMEIFVEKIVRN